jgi:membrane fusion protein, heavy metal efflux system
MSEIIEPTMGPVPASLPAKKPGLSGKLKLIGALGGTSVALLAGGLLLGSEKPVTAAPTDVPRVVDGKITFSSSFAERILLETAEVQAAPLTPIVSAVGMVTFDPRYVARVGTRLRGLISEVYHFEGENVKQGTILAELDSPELGEAQAQVTMLSAQTSAAKRDAERERRLAEQSLSTVRELDEATAQEKSYESMLHAAQQKVSALAGGGAPRALGVHTLKSPLEGTIVERHVTQGELVEGNHVAFLVADLDHLWVELDVFERALPSVHVGDAVVLRTLSGGAADLKGRVAQVSATIDSATRSGTVRIEVENTGGKLRPGQAVSAKIMASQIATEDTLLVPVSAISFVDGEPTVFALEGNNTVRPAKVALGDSNGEMKQVTQGLKAGDRVVTRGVFELKSELFR